MLRGLVWPLYFLAQIKVKATQSWLEAGYDGRDMTEKIAVSRPTTQDKFNCMAVLPSQRSVPSPMDLIPS